MSETDRYTRTEPSEEDYNKIPRGSLGNNSKANSIFVLIKINCVIKKKAMRLSMDPRRND